jgi:HSP20 family protein
MSVPGLSKDDLEITFEDNSITIKGKKKECAEDKGVKYYQKELKHSSFVRSWTLPASELDLKNKEIESNLSNGILSIKVPIKKEEKPERLKIPIK